MKRKGILATAAVTGVLMLSIVTLTVTGGIRIGVFHNETEGTIQIGPNYIFFIPDPEAAQRVYEWATGVPEDDGDHLAQEGLSCTSTLSPEGEAFELCLRDMGEREATDNRRTGQ